MARHSHRKQSPSSSPAKIALAVIIPAVLVLVALCVWIIGDNKAPESIDVAASTAAESTTNQQDSPSSSSPSAAASSTAAVSTSTSTTAKDTLMLVDTSANMSEGFSTISAAVASAALKLEQQGHSVALWNYSSPLSAQAAVGYRDNLGFGPGSEVAQSVTQLGTGGMPQTRSALIAAVEYVLSRTPNTAAITLITSGTEQDMSDDEFRNQLAALGAASADVNVISIGNNPDAVLKEEAQSFTQVANAEEAAQTLAR